MYITKLIKTIKYKEVYGKDYYDEYEICLYNDGSIQITQNAPYNHQNRYDLVLLPKFIVEKLKEMIK